MSYPKRVQSLVGKLPFKRSLIELSESNWMKASRLNNTHKLPPSKKEKQKRRRKRRRIRKRKELNVS